MLFFIIFSQYQKALEAKLQGLFAVVYYTIPRTTGELQPLRTKEKATINYTIPRTTGELQQKQQ